MKNVIPFALCALCLLITSATSDAGSGVRFAVDVAECLDADHCSAGDALDGCSASIQNCNGHGRCAFCNCNTYGCGCSCREDSSLIFTSMNDRLDLSFDRMTLEGLLGFLSEAPTGDWRFVSTVGTAGRERLHGHFRADEPDARTVFEVLDWFALRYGVCVDADDEARVVAFVKCSGR